MAQDRACKTAIYTPAIKSSIALKKDAGCPGGNPMTLESCLRFHEVYQRVVWCEEDLRKEGYGDGRGKIVLERT